MRQPLFLTILLLGACSAPGGPYPSLQPRPAEAIDPRVPVVRPINSRPVTPMLEARLAVLVDQARSGNGAFEAAAAAAERAAATAGAPQSESWIAAQEALTAAVAARKPVSTALADIDEIGSRALQTQGGIAPSDFAAIQKAAAAVAAIARRQTDRIDAIQRRIGS